MSTELQAKTAELAELQAQFDEFQVTSAQIEEELTAELRESDLRCEKLQVKVDKLEDALALAKKHQNEANQSGEQVADQLRVETTALRAEISGLNAEIRKVQSQKEQVDERLRASSALVSDLQEQLERAQEDAICLSQDFDSKKEEFEAHLHQSRQEIEDLQRDIKNLQRRNASESGDSEKVAKLTELNDILTAERDDYQLQLQEQLDTNQQLLGDALKLAQVQSELDDASQALHSTRQEIESLRQRANELQSKLDSSQSSAVDDSSLLALQDRISELEQSITDHQDNAQLADTEAADMRQQIQALKASEQASKVKISELQSTIAQLEAVRADALKESNLLQQQHAELMKATESNNELAMQQLNTEIAALKHAISAAEQDKAALVQQHTQLMDSLKQQHSNAIADLQQKLDSSISSLHTGSDLEQSLQARITALEQEQQQSVSSAKAATEELLALRQKLESVQQECCDTTSKFKDALAQLEVAQLAHSSLEREHTSSIASHSQSVQLLKDEHLKVVQELQAKLDSNRIATEQEQSTESVLKQRISELELNLTERNKQVERVESEVSDLQHQLQQLKIADAQKLQTIEELRSSMSQAEIAHSSLLQQKEETIAQLKTEHLAKLAAVETASATLSDHSVQVEQLSQRISELTASIQKHQQSAEQLKIEAEESKHKILALESAQSTQEELISQLRQQVATIEKSKQESVEKLEDEIESLKSIHSNSLAEIRAELASERFKVESAAARELELLQQIQNLQNELPRADGSTSSSQLVVSNPSQFGNLTSQLVNLRSELDSVRTQYGKMASYISQVMSLASPALLRKVQISQFESRTLLSQTEQAYRSELSKRRQLALQLADARGSVRVFCRVRPRLAIMDSQDSSDAVECLGEQQLHLSGARNSGSSDDGLFTFDHVFGPRVTQADVYSEVEPLVLSVCEGVNACVFAFGQTGSGKTFSMEGPSDADVSHRGINYRVLSTLFDMAAQRNSAMLAALDSSQATQITDTEDCGGGAIDYNQSPRSLLTAAASEPLPVSATRSAVKSLSLDADELANAQQAVASGQPLYSLNVSATLIEIYNEEFFDLLASAQKGEPSKLQARNYGPEHGGFVVPNVVSVPITSAEQVNEVLTRGAKNRAVGATNLNERSSRSHAILTVHVETYDAVLQVRTHGKLQLIDLAGSESAGKSAAVGDRLKEATHINSSLTHLATVFDAIVRKASHIPFRNSQLTQYLQDSLTGSSRVLMLLHIAPTSSAADESLRALTFGRTVRSAKLATTGAVKVNAEGAAFYKQRAAAAALESKLKDERDRIARLEAQLQSERTQAAESAAELNTRLRTMQQEVDAVAEERDRLLSTAGGSAGNASATAGNAVKTIEAELKRTKDRADRTEAEKLKLQEERLALGSELREARRLCSEAAAQTTQANNKLRTLEREREKDRAEIERLKSSRPSGMQRPRISSIATGGSSAPNSTYTSPVHAKEAPTLPVAVASVSILSDDEEDSNVVPSALIPVSLASATIAVPAPTRTQPSSTKTSPIAPPSSIGTVKSRIPATTTTTSVAAKRPTSAATTSVAVAKPATSSRAASSSRLTAPTASSLNKTVQPTSTVAAAAPALSKQPSGLRRPRVSLLDDDDSKPVEVEPISAPSQFVSAVTSKLHALQVAEDIGVDLDSSSAVDVSGRSTPSVASGSRTPTGMSAALQAAAKRSSGVSASPAVSGLRRPSSSILSAASNSDQGSKLDALKRKVAASSLSRLVDASSPPALVLKPKVPVKKDASKVTVRGAAIDLDQLDIDLDATDFDDAIVSEPNSPRVPEQEEY